MGASRIQQRGYSGITNGTLGPMANTMADLAKLYSIICGPDFTNQSDLSFIQPKIKMPAEIPTRLDGTKIGIDFNWTKFKVDPTIYSLFEDTISFFKSKGKN